MDRVLEAVPNATAVRSHSMMQSSLLLDLFADRGLTHDCNHFIPADAGIEQKPWRIWNGLTKVPYSWEDDIHCIAGGVNPVQACHGPGLSVVDFHPIHLFLNTEALDRYEAARPYLASSDRLREFAFLGRGSRSLFEELLAGAESVA